MANKHMFVLAMYAAKSAPVPSTDLPTGPSAGTFAPASGKMQDLDALCTVPADGLGTGSDFSLNIAHIKQHMLVAGVSGGGKTYMLKKILEQMLVKKSARNVMILDPEGEWPHFIKELDELGLPELQDLEYRMFKIGTSSCEGVHSLTLVPFLKAKNDAKDDRELANRHRDIKSLAELITSMVEIGKHDTKGKPDKDMAGASKLLSLSLQHFVNKGKTVTNTSDINDALTLYIADLNITGDEELKWVTAFKMGLSDDDIENFLAPVSPTVHPIRLEVLMAPPSDPSRRVLTVLDTTSCGSMDASQSRQHVLAFYLYRILEEVSGGLDKLPGEDLDSSPAELVIMSDESNRLLQEGRVNPILRRILGPMMVALRKQRVGLILTAHSLRKGEDGSVFNQSHMKSCLIQSNIITSHLATSFKNVLPKNAEHIYGKAGSLPSLHPRSAFCFYGNVSPQGGKGIAAWVMTKQRIACQKKNDKYGSGVPEPFPEFLQMICSNHCTYDPSSNRAPTTSNTRNQASTIGPSATEEDAVGPHATSNQLPISNGYPAAAHAPGQQPNGTAAEGGGQTAQAEFQPTTTSAPHPFGSPINTPPSTGNTQGTARPPFHGDGLYKQLLLNPNTHDATARRAASNLSRKAAVELTQDPSLPEDRINLVNDCLFGNITETGGRHAPSTSSPDSAEVTQASAARPSLFSWFLGGRK